jgi:hypothetical protein
MTNAELFRDYVDLEQFAAAVGRDQRTIRRWMDEPNGLPFAQLGSRRLIHGPTAEQWLLKRVQSRNPEREHRPRREKRQRKR